MAACTQDEVNAVFDAAKKAQRSWARTPLWKRAELLHKVDALLKENAQPIADALVKEIAKPAKDAKTEVVRSGDLISYTAEEGVRTLGAGKLLNSDSFPGQDRTKMCLVQKVQLKQDRTVLYLCMDRHNRLTHNQYSTALLCALYGMACFNMPTCMQQYILGNSFTSHLRAGTSWSHPLHPSLQLPSQPSSVQASSSFDGRQRVCAEASQPGSSFSPPYGADLQQGWLPSWHHPMCHR